jgi:hypothetical protein
MQWLIFSPLLSALLALASIRLSPGLWIASAVYSLFFSVPVSGVITAAMGVPLAKLLAVRLGRYPHWRAHLAAFLGLGFVSAVIVIALWMLATGNLVDAEAWWQSMWIFAPIAGAAALSVGAGWLLAWRRATRRQRRSDPALAFVAH